MTMTLDDTRRLIEAIRQLARTRVHRLDSRQLAALETQTQDSLQAMWRYLDGRPADQDVAAQARDWERKAWAAQEQDMAAVAGPPASGISSPAKAGGAPAAPPVRAPEADKVQDVGYFLHDGTLYKVVRAIYGSGNLYAKRLDLQAGEFVIVKGMMAYLRESERITEEQAIEFGRSLEVTPEMKIYGKCLICGRPLTDEDSIRNKVGPGPHRGL